MDAKSLVQKAYDDWNNRDKDAFLARFAEGSKMTTPGGLMLSGRDGVEMFWETYQGAAPDNQAIIRNLFSADNQAGVEATFEGTHTGVLHGADGRQIPPTGRHISVPLVEFYTFHGDEIATLHVYYDQVDLLTQLGLMPEPAAS